MLIRQIVFCVCVVFSEGVKLPKFFNKCRRDSPDIEFCIAKSGNEAMKFLADGNSHIRFPSLRPLKVNFMNIDVGDGLKLNLTNNEISGLDKLYINKVKMNTTAKKFIFDITLPKMEQIGQYDISGRIFLLPIFGHGPINTTFINPEIKFSFDYDITEIKGKTYLIPKNSKYLYKTNRAYFRLDNLFNGNKILSGMLILPANCGYYGYVDLPPMGKGGKEMNTFLDENWKEVNDEIGIPLGDVIGELMTEIIKGVTLRIPYEEMFMKSENNIALEIS